MPAILEELVISNIVLVRKARLAFSPGLNLLTGETGAGKSILLDALGLALGMRAEQRLVRAGSDRAQVSAVFSLTGVEAEEIGALLAEQDLTAADDGLIYLRRSLDAGGASRAFVNDQPVTVSFLRRLGERLVEVHGQHDERGLLHPAHHRRILDAFGGHDGLLAEVAERHARYTALTERLAELERNRDRVQEQRSFLQHALEELEALAPQPGEESALAEERQRLIEIGQAEQALGEIVQLVIGEGGADEKLAAALRRLERLQTPALSESLNPLVELLARAGAETTEAGHALQRLLSMLEEDPGRVEAVEERLFAIRALARKHRVEPDALGELADRMRRELADLGDVDETHHRLVKEREEAEEALQEAVAALHAARRAAARRLEREVAAELPQLKLADMRFRVRVEALAPARWTAEGGDAVAFEIASHADSPFGPLARIASGGELARLMLALKVVLREAAGAAVMVFDEIDRGIGGATAAAVGERLHRLARTGQVLLVTHSPQVAAFADRHFRIVKHDAGDGLQTRVTLLDKNARIEELGRMLSGSEISQEARRAAMRLLEQHGKAQDAPASN